LVDKKNKSYEGLNIWPKDYQQFVELSKNVFDGLDYTKLFHKILNHFVETDENVRRKNQK